MFSLVVNPLNAEINPMYHLLTLLAHPTFHISRIRVNSRSGCIIRRGICWIFLSATEPSTLLPKSDAHGHINYSACMRLFLPIGTPLDNMPR
jgi:hypothetical protein